MGRLATTWRREDGAAAVEFALLLPLWVLLMMGIISSGFAFERWINVTQGSHEGSRYGATLGLAAAGATTTNFDPYLTKLSDATSEAAGLTSSTPGRHVCVSLTYASGGSVVSRKMINGASSDGTCFTSSVTGSRVQTQVRRSTDFNLVVVSHTIPVQGQSQARWEAAP